MQTLNLGQDTTITPQWVKTRNKIGWVARITGTHPQYELARDFLPTDNPPELRREWRWWRIEKYGLFEYRDLGNGTLRGFFLIDGTFRRRIRPIAQETAHVMAARMK